ncbi:hypothetical protein ZWY2020_014561 [Hordeum vulgare]|nr:hypothetical protein ZWY2020_014561 [Hordeum vulgare]
MAKRARKEQTQKERFLKNDLLTFSPEQLITMQTEIKNFTHEYNHYHADWKVAKVRFVNLATKAIIEQNTRVAAPSQPQITQARSSPQPAEEIIRAAKEIAAREETVWANSNVAPKEPARQAEENALARTTASPVPEENARVTISSRVKKLRLPSA